jgi:penicillin-binding protein 1A
MKVFVRIAFVAVVAVVVCIGVFVVWFYSGIGLPKLSSLSEYKPAQVSKVFAADGTQLCELKGDENREIVALPKMPKAIRDAVVAIEDVDFYKHSGVNWKSVIRAVWANLVNHSVVQGGSTITQQYVKGAYVGPRRTLWRKLQEASLAYQLSHKYSKEKILEMYLNDIYFGQGCYGLVTASSKYFGVATEGLSVAQCATLAAIIRSPSYYDPYVRPETVIERRNLVIKKMEEQGYIKPSDAKIAMAEPMVLQPRNKVYQPPPAPYFCDYIKNKIRQQYGDQLAFRGGLRIYTTIDLKLQNEAERTFMRRTEAESGPSAALACIDPRTGYVKALVGGKNYFQSQYDVAAEGHRQAGSSFKVFVLTTGIKSGMDGTETYDSSSPREITMADGTKWVVRNYDGKGSGMMTVKDATIHSVNAVYAQMIMDLGPAVVAQTAKDMGIMSPVEANPAIALGGLQTGVNPLEMASAFGTLADNGVHAVPRSIYKITDAEGNVIADNKPETHQVLDPKVAAQVNEILQQVVSSGTGTGAKIGRPQAGKTGTTEDSADAWFVGYTPDLVTAVWVGYPQGRISMSGMTGGSLPASIWADFMSQALKDTPPTPFPTKEEVTSLPTDVPAPAQSAPAQTSPAPLETATVPNVVGLSTSSAQLTLQQTGYEATVVEQPSNRYAAGRVMSQTPAPGTQYSKSNSVTIIVSSGTAQNSVPNVMGMNESAAKSSITSAGFQVTVSYSAGSPAGTVISENPSGGSSLAAGSVVSITVASQGRGGKGGWPGLP